MAGRSRRHRLRLVPQELPLAQVTPAVGRSPEGYNPPWAEAVEAQSLAAAVPDTWAVEAVDTSAVGAADTPWPPVASMALCATRSDG